MGGAVLLGHVELPVSLGAPEEGSVAKTLVDGVQHLGEVLVTLLRICIGPDGGRCTLCGDDLCEHHAGFLVAKTRPEEAPCRLYGRCDDGTVVGRSVRENRVKAAACLGEVLLEAVGHGKDGHFRCQGVLGAEFCRGAGCKGCNLLREFLKGCNLMGKTAGDADTLLGLYHILELDAGDAPQLLPGAESGEVEEFPDGGFLQLTIIPGGFDAHIGQFFKAAAADSPDIFHGEGPEHFLYVLGPPHIASALEFGVFLAQF